MARLETQYIDTVKTALDKLAKPYKTYVVVALMLGIKPQNLYNWACGRRKIPLKYMDKLIEISHQKVKPWQLRPDIYKYGHKISLKKDKNNC